MQPRGSAGLRVPSLLSRRLQRDANIALQLQKSDALMNLRVEFHQGPAYDPPHYGL